MGCGREYQIVYVIVGKEYWMAVYSQKYLLMMIFSLIFRMLVVPIFLLTTIRKLLSGGGHSTPILDSLMTRGALRSSMPSLICPHTQMVT